MDLYPQTRQPAYGLLAGWNVIWLDDANGWSE